MLTLLFGPGRLLRMEPSFSGAGDAFPVISLAGDSDLGVDSFDSSCSLGSSSPSPNDSFPFVTFLRCFFMRGWGVEALYFKSQCRTSVRPRTDHLPVTRCCCPGSAGSCKATIAFIMSFPFLLLKSFCAAFPKVRKVHQSNSLRFKKIFGGGDLRGKSRARSRIWS